MSGICYVRVNFTDAAHYEKIPSPNPTIFHQQNTFYQHYFYTWISTQSPLKGYVCGIDHSPPSYQIVNRLSDECYIIFVYEGKGTINGVPFAAGDFFVIPSNYPTTMVSDKDTPWKLCWLSYKGSISQYVQNTIDRFEPIRMYTSPTPYRMQRIFSSFVYADHSHADIPSMVRSFSEFVASLITKDIVTSDSQQILEKASHRSIEYVEQAKKILTEQYATINISELSKLLYLNRKYFCQIFHKIEGITPQEYLINLRLQNSIYYLKNSNMTLKTIAEVCGYSSYTGYVDAFKNKYGISPNKYRKNSDK